MSWKLAEFLRASLTKTLYLVLDYVSLNYYVKWKPTSVLFEPLPIGFLLFKQLNLTLTDKHFIVRLSSGFLILLVKRAVSPAWTTISVDPLCYVTSLSHILLSEVWR